MPIFLTDFYNRFNCENKKINIKKIKKTIYFISFKNNIILPDKLIYFIIYSVKHNSNFIIIDKIVKKIFMYISYNVSKLTFNIIIYKWKNIINICMFNNKQNELIDYFISLYNLYLSNENNPSMFIIQTKNILGIRIGYMRHLKKYLLLNIYDTIYYIDIIFSKISKKYLSLNYIFTIN